RPETLTPSVVIVLDRSVDLYSPLLHEFTYQALVHDLIDLDGGNTYTYTLESTDGQSQSAEAELSEQKDPIWRQLRHWNISEVSQTLADKFEKLLKDNFGMQAAKQV
ncbi:Syntaxin-binding protein 1, partial [Coemansia sp. RSA 1752]